MNYIKTTFLLLLVSLSGFAQDNFFIYKKDGTKIICENGSFEPNVRNERLYYKLVGAKDKEYIKYEDMDYATLSDGKFKYFNPKLESLFVIGEDAEKSLAYIGLQQSMGHSTFYQYSLYVIDNKTYDVIDKIVFTLYPSKGKSKTRGEVPGFITKYFGNCPKVMERLSYFENDGKLNMQIAGFFVYPPYMVCK